MGGGICLLNVRSFCFVCFNLWGMDSAWLYAFSKVFPCRFSRSSECITILLRRFSPVFPCSITCDSSLCRSCQSPGGVECLCACVECTYSCIRIAQVCTSYSCFTCRYSCSDTGESRSSKYFSWMRRMPFTFMWFWSIMREWCKRQKGKTDDRCDHTKNDFFHRKKLWNTASKL